MTFLLLDFKSVSWMTRSQRKSYLPPCHVHVPSYSPVRISVKAPHFENKLSRKKSVFMIILMDDVNLLAGDSYGRHNIWSTGFWSDSWSQHWPGESPSLVYLAGSPGHREAVLPRGHRRSDTPGIHEADEVTQRVLLLLLCPFVSVRILENSRLTKRTRSRTYSSTTQ